MGNSRPKILPNANWKNEGATFKQKKVLLLAYDKMEKYKELLCRFGKEQDVQTLSEDICVALNNDKLTRGVASRTITRCEPWLSLAKAIERLASQDGEPRRLSNKEIDELRAIYSAKTQRKSSLDEPANINDIEKGQF